MVRRALIAGYGLLAYVLFLAVLIYTVGFLAGVGVPKDIDTGPRGPVWLALLVDSGLLGLFAVQHSVMARPWFKQWWTRWVAPSIERSTYVLAASLVVLALLWLWRPLPATVWAAPGDWPRWVLWTGYALGWLVVVLSTYVIGHFDLFGLRQVLARVRRRAYTPPHFREPFLYRVVRHPLMVGFLLTFWVTPDMSAGRLLFAVLSTGYILVAVRFEEHDLVGELGAPYERYLQEVPRFVPGLPGAGRRRRANGGPIRTES